MPPVVQAQIGGVRVCGKRSGDSFKTVKRNTNLINGGSCPSGYQSCGTKTPTPENTWCIKENQDNAKECPITKFKFIETNQKDEYISNDFEVLESVNGITLAFSKEST